MKKLKILSLIGALIFSYVLFSFTAFAATGDAFFGANGRTAGEGIIGDEGAISTENGNSVGTKETDGSLDSAIDNVVTDAEDMLTPDSNNGNTLGDTDGDGVVEGSDGVEGNGGIMPDENISENGDGSVESGDNTENAPLDVSDTNAETGEESTAEKTSSWLGILITLIIVIAVVCLIVTFIPKKRS